MWLSLLVILDDGKQSFQRFLAQYHRDTSWKIEDHGAFVHLVSTAPVRKIEIYANTFTADEQGINAIVVWYAFCLSR